MMSAKAFLLLGIILALPIFSGLGADRRGGKSLVLRAVDAHTGEPLKEFKVVSALGKYYPKKWLSVNPDVNGIATLDLRTLESPDLRLDVRHSEYVPLRVLWYSGPVTFPRSIPDEFTVRLEKGVKVGGVVVDETGKPVDKAKVWLTGSYNFGKSPSLAPVWDSRISLSSTNNPSAITDAKGRWHLDQFPTHMDITPNLLIQRPNGATHPFNIAPGSQRRPAVE